MKVPNFKESIKLLFTNRNFICLLIINTIIIGYFNLFGCEFNEILTNYGISSSDASLIGGIANFLGLVSCILVSVILDKSKNYHKYFIILGGLGLVSSIAISCLADLFDSSLEANKPIIFFIWAIGSSLMMITCVPFYAIGMDYVCEITYPVGELISGGFILTGSQILGVGEIALAEYFFDIKKRYFINIMSSVLILIAFKMIFWMKDDLKRNEIENEEPVENYEYEDNKDLFRSIIENDSKIDKDSLNKDYI